MQESNRGGGGGGGGGAVFMISYMSMCGFKGYQFLSRFWSESLETGMDSRKPGLKMDIAKLMFWSEIGSGFRELSHTPSPKIPRSTCDLNARFQSNFCCTQVAVLNRLCSNWRRFRSDLSPRCDIVASETWCKFPEFSRIGQNFGWFNCSEVIATKVPSKVVCLNGSLWRTASQ